MKTRSLSVLAAFFFVGTLVSCGGGMTAEQIDAEALKKFEGDKTELTATAGQDCEANMEAYTAEALQTLQAEKPQIEPVN